MNTHPTPVSASLRYPRLVTLLALAMVTAAIPVHAQTNMRPGQQADRNSSAPSARQQPGYQNMDRDRIQSSNTENPIDLSSALLADELRGRDVHNSQNEKIGSISDVVVDVTSGRAPYVVVRSGGLLGMGTTQRAVPTGSLTRRAASGGDKESFVLNTSKDVWDRAPTLEGGRLGDLEDEVQGRDLPSVYGRQSTADDSSPDTRRAASHSTHGHNPSDRGQKNAGMDSDMGPSRSGTDTRAYSAETPGLSRANMNPGTGYDADADARNRADTRSSNATNSTNSTNSTHATNATDPNMRDSDTQALSRPSASTFGGGYQRGQKLVFASELKGKRVVSSAGEYDLGSIKDIIIAPESSQAAILLDPADDLGDDQTYVIPFSRVTRRSDDQRYTADFERGDFSRAAGSGATDRDSGEVRRWPADDRSRTQTRTQTNPQSSANDL